MMKKVIILICCVLLLAGCSTKPEKKDMNLSDEYPNLRSDNHFYYAAEDGIEAFLEHGTGLLLFGSAERDEEYVLSLENNLKEVDITSAYYDYEKSKNNSVKESIQKILVVNNIPTQFNKPLLVFVEEGVIVNYDDGLHLDEKAIKDALSHIKKIREENGAQGCDDACDPFSND